MGRNIDTGTAISALIIFISIFFWLLLLSPDQGVVVHYHKTMTGPSTASFKMFIAMNPLSDRMMGWTIMVLAMMLPKLITPVQYIHEHSLKRRRFLSTILFIGGYCIVWILMGLFMNAIILVLGFLLNSSWLPVFIIGSIAIVWQFSPYKQRSLNRGHIHRSLSAFGWESLKDALLYGVEHGIWCVCSGWALMLFPMLLPVGHNMAMLLVTLVMLSEHMEHPQVPCWRLNFRLKLFRIIMAQTKMRLKLVFSPQTQITMR